MLEREAARSVASRFLFCMEVKSMVKINGESLPVAGQTLAAYLAATDYDLKRIAVERNGEIIPKAQYGETVLVDGDSLEVVSLVGGG